GSPPRQRVPIPGDPTSELLRIGSGHLAHRHRMRTKDEGLRLHLLLAQLDVALRLRARLEPDRLELGPAELLVPLLLPHEPALDHGVEVDPARAQIVEEAPLRLPFRARPLRRREILTLDVRDE